MHFRIMKSIPLVLAILICLLAGCSGSSKSHIANITAPYEKQNPVLSQWPEKPVPDHLALARQLIDQGHYDVALAQLAQAAANQKNKTEIAFLAGVCHLETEAFLKAGEYFRQAIELDAGYAPAHNGMGMVLAGRGDADRALPYFRKAMALDPAKPNACNNLGYTLMKTGQAAEAETVLRRCLAIDPGFHRAANNLAVCLTHQQKDDQALALLMRIHPSAVAYRNMQALLISRGDMAGAEVMEAKAIRIENRRGSGLGDTTYTTTPLE